MIPHSRPTVTPADAAAVSAALLTGQLAQGEQVRRFEEAVAAYAGRAGAVATSSGTSALHLALLALGVGAGDEVLIPSYTCVALVNAIHYVGAVPLLAEIDPLTYNLDAEDARRRLTPSTRAAIVPHMFGLPADIAPMMDWGIPLIEDCAQTFGATYQGRPVGGFGAVSVCSFYATKVFTTGEGGMLLSDSETVLRRARDLRDYDGRPTLQLRFNYKMTDFQGALGLSQFRRLPEFLARRGALASRYDEALRNLPVRLPTVPPDRTHIFYRYVVRANDAPQLAARLQRQGIGCKSPVGRPLHQYLQASGFARTDHAMRTALSLPLYPSLSDEDADAVAQALAVDISQQEDLQRSPLSLPI
ncbi:MAG TPA: DegT/DnrJ/EryC1/StrS family aminotransferase [bacterium]|nr:DegT/DnrJ/EryC1/StrS family aminotransferase [bacterium]